MKIKNLPILTQILLLMVSISFLSTNAQVNVISKNVGEFTIKENAAKDGGSFATIKKTNKGENVNFKLPNGESVRGFSGTLEGKFDKDKADFYCIDVFTSLDWKAAYTSDGNTSEEITYILNNYYPYKDLPYSNSLGDKKEAAAVQLAIWYFSDQVDPETISSDNTIKNRVLQIINDAENNAGDFVSPSTITITPAIQNLELNQTAQFQVKISDIDGNPIQNIGVTLSSTKGTLSSNLVTTNSNGIAQFTLTSNSGGVSTVTASAEIEIPQGTRFVKYNDENGSQQLVLATPVDAEASAVANVNWNSNEEDCDGDGNNDISLFDGYEFKLVSVSLNNDNTSTWEYKVTGKGASRDLSHWVLALCEDHEVLSTNYSGNQWEVNTDPRTGVYGLKFDVGVGKNGESKTFIFTLEGHYDVKPIQVAFKASTNNYYCTINGPDCDFGGGNCENTIGNFIWHDNNPADGIQNNGEAGIEGVIVKLLDNNNNVVSSTITDENGKYRFIEVDNGGYKVKIAEENFLENGVFYSNNSIRTKWHLTTKESGNDKNVDSNGDENYEAAVTVDCGDDLSIDFGFYKTGLSFEKSGQETSVYGEDIIYSFIIKNLGDVPFANGVYVYDEMINTEGDHLIKSKSNLLPNEEWEFEKAVSLSNPACDQVVVNTALVSANPKLTTGIDLDQIDANSTWSTTIVCDEPGEIGNKVWIDENKNGLQDDGENGLAGIKVKLFNCDNVYVKDMITDENGNYLFTDLVPGDYKLQFVLPESYEFTNQNSGSDELDSDANPNDGFTECTNLEAGESDLTWDAGIVEIIRKSDLRIQKTSNNTNASDGDLVTYTITVTNDGPDAASGIKVFDVLGDGLDYVSSSPNGVFNSETGIWTVGALNNAQSAVLSIDVKMNSKSCEVSSFDFGIAKGYNLFLLKDLTAPSADVEGKVAVGRDVSIANYSIGFVLNSSYSNQDVLVVGRDLNFTSGRIYFGNVAYGGSTNLPVSQASIDGELRKDTPINFVEAESYLLSLSSTLAAYEVNENAFVSYEGSRIFLDGSDPFLNIFEVEGAKLSASTDLNINVPNGSVALINIDGDNIVWSGGLEITGTDKTNILYNYPQATQIKISNIDVRGSILAPKAVIDFPHGLVSGQLIAKSMFGAGQVNNNLFVGNIPCQKEINNVAEIIESNSIDVNLNNNISTAQVTLEITNDPAGDPTNDEDDWVAAGSFASNEIVWTMNTSDEGVMYAGTWGGNIYSSANDAVDWNVINTGMGVAYIWSIAIDNANGNIWAATEKGLYLSQNGGSNWNLKALENNDVRAVVVASENHVYAGVWGGGVYEQLPGVNSEFTELNEGLTVNAVHALALNSQGDLYAGTFGGGVYKLSSGESEWVSTETPAIHIWALGITSEGHLYAGSYGDGVYGSFDDGESWYNLSNDLPNNYIYSIAVDQSDNVYLTAWNGGVKKLAGSGSNGNVKKGGNSIQSVIWEPIGLDGFGVSTLIVNHVTSTLFAGTNEGQVFKKADGLTSVEEEVEIPTEYRLEQNYPNPFNPSTVIKYSLPTSEHVSLTLFDVLGNEIALLVNETKNAGVYNYQLSTDQFNLSSGVYFYRIKVGSFISTKKLILLK